MNQEKGANINTVLLTLGLALGGWGLVEQNGQGKALAAYAVRADAMSLELAELRVRVQATDTAIQEVKLQIARWRGGDYAR